MLVMFPLWYAYYELLKKVNKIRYTTNVSCKIWRCTIIYHPNGAANNPSSLNTSAVEVLYHNRRFGGRKNWVVMRFLMVVHDDGFANRGVKGNIDGFVGRAICRVSCACLPSPVWGYSWEQLSISLLATRREGSNILHFLTLPPMWAGTMRLHQSGSSKPGSCFPAKRSFIWASLTLSGIV